MGRWVWQLGISEGLKSRSSFSSGYPGPGAGRGGAAQPEHTGEGSLEPDGRDRLSGGD